MSDIEQRPFHQTIIDAIKNANGSQLCVLAELIKATRVPENHDAIIAAWTIRRLGMHAPDEGVLESLQLQKERANKQEGGM